MGHEVVYNLLYLQQQGPLRRVQLGDPGLRLDEKLLRVLNVLRADEVTRDQGKEINPQARAPARCHAPPPRGARTAPDGAAPLPTAQRGLCPRSGHVPAADGQGNRVCARREAPLPPALPPDHPTAPPGIALGKPPGSRPAPGPALTATSSSGSARFSFFRRFFTLEPAGATC